MDYYCTFTCLCLHDGHMAMRMFSNNMTMFSNMYTWLYSVYSSIVQDMDVLEHEDASQYIM